MRLLLDTHALLWFLLNDPQLSAAARALMVNPANLILVSHASSWEMSIQAGLGKLALTEPTAVFLPREVAANGFVWLPISLEHTTAVESLPLHHRDPFDRMLAVQSLTEGVPVISVDDKLDPYGVTRLW